MNRRTLLTTLLSGLSAGVAAIAGKGKSVELNNSVTPDTSLRRKYAGFIWKDPVERYSQWCYKQTNPLLHYSYLTLDNVMHGGYARLDEHELWYSLGARRERGEIKSFKVAYMSDYA